jgi:hypothetical protein
MKRLPQISWKPAEHDRHGNPSKDSLDGMIRLRKSCIVDGVRLPIEWQVWWWHRGRWHKYHYGRGKAKALKVARVLRAELDAVADDED